MMRKMFVDKWNELLYYPNIHVLIYTKRPNLLSLLDKNQHIINGKCLT